MASGDAGGSHRYAATLQITLTKTWRVAREVEQPDGCSAHENENGSRTLSLRSRKRSPVTVVERGGRVRFVGAVVTSLDGTLRAGGGGKTRRVDAEEGCAALVVQAARCARAARRVRGASLRFAAPRRNTIVLGRLRLRVRGGLRTCPGDPEEVRQSIPPVGSAEGDVPERWLLDRGTGQVVVNGDTTTTTTLQGGASGSVVERVRWTLTLDRVDLD